MTTTFLAGNAKAGGIVGVFDPAGIRAHAVHALRQLTDGRALMELPRVAATCADRPLAVLAGEIFDLGEVSTRLGLPATIEAAPALTAGYRRWGRGLARHLRGSFALVVVDETTGNALVTADPAGAHSIVFRADGDRLYFASEIHLLLKLLPSRPGPNHVAVAHWFSGQSARPAGETLYDGISEVMGGECLEIGDGSWSRSRYWAPRYEAPAAMSRAEAGEFLWAALVGAVGARLGSGESVGIVMSSGVDSSAVAAAAVAAVSGRDSTIHSYSAVFPDDPQVDETARIDQLVAALGLQNTQVRLRPGGGFALALDWTAAWDLPLLDFGYVLERPLIDLAASEGVVGLLDGEYGDEAFGTPVFWLADLLRRGRVLSSLRMARRLPGEGTGQLRSGLDAWRSYALAGAIPLRLQAAIRRRDPYRYVPDFLTEASARLVVETDAVWDWKKLDEPRWWAEKAHLLTVDRQAVGIAGHLRQRAALSGLRARSPLLDVDVIQCLLRIPPELDFDPVLNRPSIRQAMRGRVPDNLRLSPRKSDLGPFFFDGLAGPDLEAIRSILGPGAEVHAWVRPESLREMVDRPPDRLAKGWRQWFVGVWKLGTAEIWLRSQGDAAFAERLGVPDLPRTRSTVHRRHPPRRTAPGA